MNKIYIKVALALLALSGYMQNGAYASEAVEKGCTENCSLRHRPLSVYQQYKEETNGNIDEAIEALTYSENSKDILLKLADADVQEFSDYGIESDRILYIKKIGNMNIGRLDITIPYSSKYKNAVRQYWDYKYDKNPDEKIINGKVARLYCKDKVLIEKLNTDPDNTSNKKIYSLASRNYNDDMTVIICPSRVLDFDGEINKETELEDVYKNQKLIETDIHPVEALNKYGDNIAGFIIKNDEKYDQVRITYINAIYDNGNPNEVSRNLKHRTDEFKKITELSKKITPNNE
ncbi:fam-a protein [Plasmodium vinckei vinckei]|uniref:Fam-a protein n=1 Tax=Plasmodium vinckei vinckei TaxID=54757 RepID=A0A449BMV2_PLAVN|nr:fam-a protein [Plasmodium vinckei vinckei]VEV54729.1 fam-a protein [Plasmodium vinckei vinckei]